MLPNHRVVFQGETPYPHEREAIEFIIKELPDADPYHLWALVDLLDPTTGRLYEIDAIVIGYSAIYLIEIKSGPGVYTGDTQDWYRTPPGESRGHYLENPHRLTNHKAKVLKSRLRTAMADPKQCPRVEALVFLSHPDAGLQFRNHGNHATVSRETLLQALKEHRFPGSPSGWRGDRLNRPTVKDVSRALEKIGVKPRRSQAMAGSYALGNVVHEGPGYQDRIAKHDKLDFLRRARTYLVPEQTTVERRQQLRRAADRESQLLWDVKDHPNILSIIDSVETPLGPTVIFEAFEDGVPLDAFLRKRPDLSFSQRVELVEQVARALAFCHRRGIIHGAVSPDAVLVRTAESGAVETRLFNFQLGVSERIEATSHWSALASERWAVYQAPELRQNASARSEASDVFSLGALAFLVFTGRAPGNSASDVDQMLSRSRHLDPGAVSESVAPEVSELIKQATVVSPISRPDDTELWADLLLEAATTPDADGPSEVNPLDAGPKAELAGGLTIIQTLGTGATSKVLRVRRAEDGREYALKIALSSEHDQRIRDEAATLRELRHPRILQLVDELELGARACLLVGLAGSETLHHYLNAHGTISLDLAARYGDDLLSALDYLEEKQVLHRDIKPANLGVGAVGKEASHLTLFDFSLASVPLDNCLVGTAIYRDPFLGLRGAWDFAAERWSAAITLHEMLTGARPSFGNKTAIDPHAELSLAAERFDPSVRDTLTAFFQRALAREPADRFESASAMRRAWLAAFDGAQDRVADDARPTASPNYAAIDEKTPIEALPLSNRARNALDRAGLTHAEEILDLPDNRLSAIRGVGRLVAQEIHEFRQAWQSERSIDPQQTAPFYPGFRGEDVMIATTNLPAPTSAALQDAGLATLGQIASAPKRQVRALAAKHGFRPKDVTELLDREHRHANEGSHPTSLEGWIEALLPLRMKRMKTVRSLFGLGDDRFRGRLDAPARELAEERNVTRAAIYQAVSKCRGAWAKHAAMPELRSLVHESLDAMGGAAPLHELANAILSKLLHDSGTDDRLLRSQALALARIVVEVDKEDTSGATPGCRWSRIHGEPWLVRDAALASVIGTLGDVADRLAARDVLAAPGEVTRELGAIVEETPLATLPPERLVSIAVAASREAARSSRLEIYPIGMEPARALELSAAILTSRLTPDELAERVALRYPVAHPLPERPELDALVAVHGLYWNETDGRYERQGEAGGPSSLGTSFPSPRHSTAPPSVPRAMDPEAIDARQFEDRMRNAIERKRFRVVGINAARAHEGAIALAKAFGLEIAAFDERLLRAMRARMERGKIRDDVIHEADRLGPVGEHWRLLVRLIEESAESVLDELVPSSKPTLLVQPGPIARYRLGRFVEQLNERADAGDSESVILLVPAHDTGGIPTINDRFALPGVLQSQALWVSSAWLSNKQNAAA